MPRAKCHSKCQICATTPIPCKINTVLKTAPKSIKMIHLLTYTDWLAEEHWLQKPWNNRWRRAVPIQLNQWFPRWKLGDQSCVQLLAIIKCTNLWILLQQKISGLTIRLRLCSHGTTNSYNRHHLDNYQFVMTCFCSSLPLKCLADGSILLG
jgi:hypothetical protein